MVKIENCDEGDAAGADAPRGGAMDPQQLDPTRAIVKAEEATQNSGSGSLTSLGSLFGSDDEENSAPLMPRIETRQHTEELDSFSKRRSYLLSKMSFSKKEVDLAFSELGERASLDRLVDWILTAQEATVEGQQVPRPIQSRKMVKIENCDEGDAARAPRGGAMDPQQLDPTRAIFKAEEGQQIPRPIQSRKKVKIEHCDEGDATRADAGAPRGGGMDPQQPDPMRAIVKAEEAYAGMLLGVMDKRLSLLQMGFTEEEVSSAIATSGQEATIEELADSIFARRFSNTIEQKKDDSLERTSGPGRNIRGDLAKPPFFLYASLVDISKDTWDCLSRFLFSVQPEYLNSKSFSALTQREGYIHNLPMERRHVVVRRSSMTITDVLGPLQPHQLERVLGYPANHTDLPGLNPQDKVASMRFALQTDTVAFLLSVLKDRYPDGLRVFSIYSGVGGAEVALHRLGIPLRCVVSVEQSAVNRRMLKRWWGETEQAGELRQLPSTCKLNPRVLEEMMNEFGGFDLVIGGNYSPYKGGTNTVSAKMGMDSTQFFEYVRVVESVRSHARS